MRMRWRMPARAVVGSAPLLSPRPLRRRRLNATASSSQHSKKTAKKVLHSSCTGQKWSIFINYISDLLVTDIWSGREDSNLRPPGPKPGALPGCATPRRRSRYMEAADTATACKPPPENACVSVAGRPPASDGPHGVGPQEGTIALIAEGENAGNYGEITGPACAESRRALLVTSRKILILFNFSAKIAK